MPESELQKLADDGDPAAQYVLWWRRRGTHKAEGGALLESAAKAGLPQAMLEKGSSLFIQTQEPLDRRREGWAMIEQAAASGFVPARITVAKYEAGFVSSFDAPVKANLNRALEYFRDGVAVGDTDSLVCLASLYTSGIGEPRNESESAHNLLLRAAKQGDTGAMLQLSARYTYGFGEEPDPLEAARWRFLARQPGEMDFPEFQIIDAEGNPKAQDSVTMDDTAKAFSLFVRAAEQRNPRAGVALAKQYLESGRAAEAFVLFTFAEHLGGAESSAALEELQASVTAEQKTNASKLFPFLNRRR